MKRRYEIWSPYKSHFMNNITAIMRKYEMPYIEETTNVDR